MSTKIYTDAYYLPIEEEREINRIIGLRKPIERWYGYGEDSYCEVYEVDEIQSFKFKFCDEYGDEMDILLKLFSGTTTHIEVVIKTYNYSYSSDSVEEYDHTIMIIPEVTRIEGKYKILYNDNIYELTITDNYTEYDKISEAALQLYKENLNRKYNSYDASLNDSSDDSWKFSDEELKEYWGDEWDD